MRGPNNKAAAGACNTHSGYQTIKPAYITSNPSAAAPRVGSQPAPGVFNRVQERFSTHGRLLLRSRPMYAVHVSYIVRHRGDSRHFAAWAAVLAHLRQIVGAS